MCEYGNKCHWYDRKICDQLDDWNPCFRKAKPLILPLKREYWEMIRDDQKGTEFRIMSPYWIKRLVGKNFSHVECRLGYPKNDDSSRILKRKWKGFYCLNFHHKHFGPDSVDAFAIDVSEAL